MEGIGEVKLGFVVLVGPIVDSVCAWPGAVAAVRELARFPSFVDDVNKALRG